MISGSFKATTSNYAIYGTVNWSSSVNTGTNTSNVTASMTLRKYHIGNVTQITAGQGTWQLSINGVVYSIIANKTFNFTTDTIVISNTVTVPHNPDGTKTCVIEVTGGISGTSYTWTNAKSEVQLETITVKATILTATDFLDTENPTLTFTNPKNYPVQFKLEDINSHTDLIVTEKLVDYVGDSYTFNLTNEQREILRVASQNYSKFPIRFTISSYIPSDSLTPTYWSWLDRTMTVTSGMPVFSNFNHEDIEPVTLDITGDSSVYIQNLSKCKVYVSNLDKMVAQKDSLPKGYTATVGKYSDYQPYTDTLDVVFTTFDVKDYSLYSNITVTALDSRDKSTTVSKPMTIIPYVPNGGLLSATCSPRVGDDGKVTLNASGKYYPIVVNSVEKNEVFVVFQYKDSESESWSPNEDMVVHLSNGNFTCDPVQIVGLDVAKTYDVRINASDFYDSIGEELLFTVSPNYPIMYIHKDGKIGVNKIPDGETQGLYLRDNDHLFSQIESNMSLLNNLSSDFFDRFFPVGSCYTVGTTFDGVDYVPIFDPNDDMPDGEWDKLVDIYPPDDPNPIAVMFIRTV